MIVYFGFWIISLGLIFIGALKSVGSDRIIMAGFFGVISLIAYTFHSHKRASYRWKLVFGLIGAGAIITFLGNALSYIREDGVVVDNLLMPFGAITIGAGILFAAHLSILFVGHRLYTWICHVRQ